MNRLAIGRGRKCLSRGIPLLGKQSSRKALSFRYPLDLQCDRVNRLIELIELRGHLVGDLRRSWPAVHPPRNCARDGKPDDDDRYRDEERDGDVDRLRGNYVLGAKSGRKTDDRGLGSVRPTNRYRSSRSSRRGGTSYRASLSGRDGLRARSLPGLVTKVIQILPRNGVPLIAGGGRL